MEILVSPVTRRPFSSVASRTISFAVAEASKKMKSALGFRRTILAPEATVVIAEYNEVEGLVPGVAD